MQDALATLHQQLDTALMNKTMHTVHKLIWFNSCGFLAVMQKQWVCMHRPAAACAANSAAKEHAVWQTHNFMLLLAYCCNCRENVHRIAKDGYLFVTWANHHYTDFAMSWVHHLQSQNVTNFMVGSMDDQILSTLAKRKIPTFSMQSGERRVQVICNQQLLVTVCCSRAG